MTSHTMLRNLLLGIFVLAVLLCIPFIYFGMSTFMRYDILPRENETINIFPGENETINIFPPNDETVINRFEYFYPINIENACNKLDTLVVFMPVNSAMTNFYRRNVTRHSRQYKYANENRNSVRILFFVGLPSAKLAKASVYQKQLEAEAKTYGDIIQSNVADTYRNLSLKAVGTLHWTVKYCSNSKVILKLDDDVNFDHASLLQPLYKLKEQYENFVLGTMGINEKPNRDNSSKHHVSKEDYPNAFYPPFVFGPAEGFPTTTATLLYQQAIRTKMISLDDVFITGMCRKALGIPIFHSKNFELKFIHKKMEAPNLIVSE